MHLYSCSASAGDCDFIWCNTVQVKQELLCTCIVYSVQLQQETVISFGAIHCKSSRRSLHLYSYRRRMCGYSNCDFILCNTWHMYRTAAGGDCDLMQMSAPSNIFLSCPVLILLLKPFTFFSHHVYTSLLTASNRA